MPNIQSLQNFINAQWVKSCPNQSPVNSNARLRLLERHGAAALRALSGVPEAEYRASRVRIDGKPAPFAAPYLAVDFNDAELTQSRGIMDSLGLRLRYSDMALHKALSPPSGFGKLVFDVMEHMRCESIIDPAKKGLRENLDAAFMQWCHAAHGNGFCDSDLGILLYTVIHMVRARLIGTMEDETAEALIEATRANLGPMIGKPLYQLKKSRLDQRAFAEHAIEIANTLHQLVSDAADENDDEDNVKRSPSLMLPPDWEDSEAPDEIETEGVGGLSVSDSASAALDNLGDYHVFTNTYDTVSTGDALIRRAKIVEHREQLDKLVKAQAVSVTRLARELQHLLANPVTDGWLFGQDEGYVDARRLAQLVSNPDYHQVFVRDRLQLKADSAVTFLIDNSGSMKSQRYEAVAVLVDTFCRALALANVQTEVLGFTTRDWNGGRAMNDWRKAGQPENPGRLGELQHIVYKSHDESWRRSRSSMAALLDTHHFREGVDGEALIWAYQRLKLRTEQNRLLVVISDGVPMDAATHNTNRDGFLSDHLAGVARFIDKDPTVALGAIGIDLDMSDTYRQTVSLDLGGTLGQSSYRVLHTLFGSSCIIQ